MTMQSISYSLICLAVLVGVSLATSPTQSSPTVLTASGPGGSCTKVSSCKCSYPDGTVIDLTPLSRTDGTAYFSSITSKGSYVYYWNPCNPFSYPTGKTTSACGNVAVCMRPPVAHQGVLYSLGAQNTATFTKDRGGVHLSYAFTQGGYSYSYVANIILKCNHTLQNSVLDVDTVPIIMTNTSSVFSFILNSKYACNSLPKSSLGSTVSTRGGSTST